MTSLTKLNCQRGHAHTYVCLSQPLVFIVSTRAEETCVRLLIRHLKSTGSASVSPLLPPEKKEICVIVKAALLGGENRVATWAVLKTRRSLKTVVFFKIQADQLFLYIDVPALILSSWVCWLTTEGWEWNSNYRQTVWQYDICVEQRGLAPWRGYTRPNPSHDISRGVKWDTERYDSSSVLFACE